MNPADFISQFSPIANPVLGVRLPVIQLEEKYLKELNLPKETSNFDFLRALCKKGFLALNLKKGTKEYDEYTARIKYELDTLNELGFTDYILLVWDVLNFCHENNISTGPGRGSAAGSLVLFLIGVTKIDSIKHGLYFERFVSKSRAKKTIIDGVTYLDGTLTPDVDFDAEFYRRGEVLKYIETKYLGRTCKILTLNTLSSKLLIKEVGKVLGMKAEDEMTMVTSMIPKSHGIVEEITDAVNGLKDKNGEWKVKPVPELKEWCDKNPLIYETSLKLNNLNKNFGVHPSGLLISFDLLEDCCPTQLSSDKDLVSSYSMNDVASFAVKLDVLGLRSVSVIEDCCKSLGIKPTDINVNDLSIYRALQDLKSPHGLFQIETLVGYNVTQKVKPKNLGEISAVLAIARPGALQFTEKFATYSNTGVVDSIHPFFDDVLHETGNLCLYQEQALKMANKIGFTLDESEQLRRAIGKKDLEKIKSWEKKIQDKIIENKLPQDVGEVFWRIIEDSGGYSFNKCAFEEETVQEETRGKIMLKDVKVGDKVKAYNVTNDLNHFVEVIDVIAGSKELYEITIEDGRTLRVSLEHKLLCEDKVMRPLKEIIEKQYRILTD